MGHTLFNAIIHPLMLLMEALLDIFYSFTGSYGLSIVLLSVGVNTILAPFYALADRWQNEEQSLLKKMEMRRKEIREVFKGDERHFYLRTLYRHTGYSPLMSIRSSFGLLIQIPFFMAAYNFLSHYGALEGAEFLFFNDLAKPDSLLGPVNLMPFLMTGVNLIAARKFTQGQNLRSRIQLYGMAAFFMVLLYASPAGLLLYWTCNNIYSMVRIFLKEGRIMKGVGRVPVLAGAALRRMALPGKFLAGFTGLVFMLLAFLFVTKFFLLDNWAWARLFLKFAFVYLGVCGSLLFLKLYKNDFARQLNLLILLGLWFLIGRKLGDPMGNRHFPYFYMGFTMLLGSAVIIPALAWINAFMEKRKLLDEKSSTGLFRKSLSSLFLMSVFVIPFLLLGNVPGEINLARGDFFSMLTWALLYLVCIPLFIRSALPGELKKPFALIVFTLLICGLIDFLAFPGSYGYINDSLQFTSEVENSTLERLINLSVLGLPFLLTAVLIFLKKAEWLKIASNITLLLLIALSIYTWGDYKIKKQGLEDGTAVSTGLDHEIKAEIPLSRTEKNTVVLMIDRALGGSIPYTLENFPELEDVYSGFTWYKNTISYGNCTIIGLPGLLGGYDYTPSAMLERPEIPVNQKVMESWTVLPAIFRDMDKDVYVSDPSNHNIDKDYSGIPLTEMEGVTVSKLHGRYAGNWLKEYLPHLSDPSVLMQRGKSFFMFSVFRMAPNFLREQLYNDGVWYSGSPDRHIREMSNNWGNFMEILKPWSTLEYLPELTKLQERGSYSFIYNMGPHEEMGIDGDFNLSPGKIEYREKDVKRFGSKSAAAHYYTNAAVLHKIGEWLDWLKEKGVYDNTQIVIVADHGRAGLMTPLIPLDEQGADAIPYNGFMPLLMFKPYGASGSLEVGEELMSNTDTPALVLEAFGGGTNPYTGHPIDHQGKYKKQVLGKGHHKYEFHTGATFNMTGQYRVSENALDPNSWEMIPESDFIGR